MRFSQQVQYAICGVFDLAYNGLGEPVRIRAISERQSIPNRYLEQIFQRLRRAGLVTSKRGPGGGYSLARDPAQITLREVVEAVEGPLQGARRGRRGAASRASRHRPEFLWGALAQRLASALDAITLADVCGEAVRARVERVDADAPMYFI